MSEVGAVRGEAGGADGGRGGEDEDEFKSFLEVGVSFVEEREYWQMWDESREFNVL